MRDIETKYNKSGVHFSTFKKKKKNSKKKKKLQK